MRVKEYNEGEFKLLHKGDERDLEITIRDKEGSIVTNIHIYGLNPNSGDVHIVAKDFGNEAEIRPW